MESELDVEDKGRIFSSEATNSNLRIKITIIIITVIIIAMHWLSTKVNVSTMLSAFI